MNATPFVNVRLSRPTRRRVSTTLALASALTSVAGAANFTPLGYLPGGYFYSEAHDVSANGRVVVGQAHHGDVGNEAFRWTAEGGMQGLNDFPTGDFWSTASAVSN